MLSVDNLSFSYLQEKTLDGVGFQVAEGELACLLGPNGSGKTTILKCINGLLKGWEGTIRIKEMEIAEMNSRQIARYISMVPQEHRVVFAYRVIDVVAMGITPYLAPGAVPGSEVYQRAEQILRELHISHLSARNYNEISGGERQLVLIGRALLQSPQLLVLDEPTAHLDFKNTHYLLELIRQLNRQGVTVLTALHDPNLALKYSDRVILVKEGRVLALGSREEVMTEENLQKTYGISISSSRLGDGLTVVVPLVGRHKQHG